jgi:hypothetical protein
MTRTKSTAWLSLIGGLAVTGYAATASAQVTEYSLILLDRTGSMSEPTATDPGTGAVIATRWTDAMDAASSLITGRDLTDLATTRAYSIWDFRVLGEQTTAQQVWPASAADCPADTSFITVTASGGGTNNYCDFRNNNPGPYAALLGILTAYKTDPNRTPDATRLGRTPLAHALCRSLDQIRLTIAAGGARQTITLESDGIENESPVDSVCGSFREASTHPTFIADPNFVFTKNVQDWGLSGLGGANGASQIPAGSWEARVVRRALRLNNPDAANAITNLPITTAPETAATNIAWRVDVHYRTCASGTNPCQAGTAIAPLAAFSQIGGGDPTAQADGPAAAPVAALLVSGGGTTGQTVTVTPTQSIPLGELNFFKNLASPRFPTKNGGSVRSFYREIKIEEGQVFGRTHLVPGDVDDSRCTDQADLNIVMQKDVWMQRAVRPCEICERADLNRDGWVNKADRAIVINNWGANKNQPCRPGPKPPL